MPLPRPLSALLTTIVAAVPAAITTVALNKPKPPREIDKVIELDENTETISEPEIIPEKAPDPSPPPLPPLIPSGSQHSSGGEKGTQEEAVSPNEDDSQTFEESDNDSNGEGDTDATEDAGTEEDLEEEESGEDKDKDSNEIEEQQPDNQDPSTEDASLSEDEIKKALLEVIKSLSEKQGFNLQTADLYPLFTVKSEVEKLISLIKQLEEAEKKKSKDGEGNGGSEAGVGAPTKSP